jgi:hypothetical protein
MLKYVQKELATPGEIVKQSVIFGSKIPASKINEKIQQYADDFVFCKACGKPENKTVKGCRCHPDDLSGVRRQEYCTKQDLVFYPWLLSFYLGAKIQTRIANVITPRRIMVNQTALTAEITLLASSCF